MDVYSKDCADITLIDLPGIVRAVGKNDDPRVVKDIKIMIDEYLINERCIIFAIVPANVEFHNS